MRYIILPIEDAQVVFSAEELETMRKSVDGKEVIAHEETLLKKREQLGFSTLPSEETGQVEWTYPVYIHGSGELGELLASPGWTSPETE